MRFPRETRVPRATLCFLSRNPPSPDMKGSKIGKQVYWTGVTAEDGHRQTMIWFLVQSESPEPEAIRPTALRNSHYEYDDFVFVGLSVGYRVETQACQHQSREPQSTCTDQLAFRYLRTLGEVSAHIRGSTTLEGK